MRWSKNCAFSPIAQRTAKKLLNDTEDSPLSIAIELEATATRACAVRKTSREGVEAFHSKRKPNFVGR
jgi:2-oxoglutaroyl-CoA hydrolase